MIENAPFLGQVRISNYMGQLSPNEVMAQRLLDLLAPVLASLDEAPEPDRKRLREKAESCRNLINGILTLSPGLPIQSMSDTAEVCITDLKADINRSIQGTKSPSAPQNLAPTSAGASTWGWVVGGLAAVGLVVYVATKWER